MGDIADEHFVELFWNEGTGIGADGGLGPPIDHPAYGGMNAYIRRHTAPSRIQQEKKILPAAVQRPRPRPLMSVDALFSQMSSLKGCPGCGAPACVIEYPLGVSCSRGSCQPGKMPIYISEKDAVEAGFTSVIECWNTAQMNQERNALIWPK